MSVLLHIPPDHGAIEDVERGEQGCRAVALVIMGHRAEPPFLERQSRLGPVKRLNLAFLVEGQHDGVCGRIDIKPDDIVEFIGKRRIIRQLELPEAVRCRPCAFQMRRTALALILLAAAIMSAVQCVVSPGASLSVRATTRSASSGARRAMREGRVLSRSKPSTPSAMKRSCQRQTQVLDLPVRRMIAAVPTPSADNKMIDARQTCFCGAL
jgi:hypothetical protein